MEKKNISQINRQKKCIRKRKKKINMKKRFRLLLSLLAIIISSFFITKQLYISNKCTDLSYSVEHNFTTGLDSKNKLLRVQEMSLVYCDGETAVVEASGLSKSDPHKKTSIKGNFKKIKDSSWILQESYPVTASID
ncbi:hypothetical protein [Clostridium uliginosum]|uniref:Uncharacterized protein n=1 Tax=Clostridium uliginosum TaxID=119641 RepID=A0A1I1RG20_9CLOT|nr:hypothetical protein [Clostridium uliginosum]SFD33294.1 hypothetical protein SAMN05421842_13321 [Clostridium uliginosum]